jgi:IS5 family transposase
MAILEWHEMRSEIAEQMSLMVPVSAHRITEELTQIDKILDQLPEARALVLADLTTGVSAKRGRKGQSAEQVLRVVILQKIMGLTFDELAFHLGDSATFRAFCRLGFQDVIRRSALHKNVKRVRPETLEQINHLILAFAKKEGIEDGKKIRGDTTVVESDIHPPSDNWLLWDVVRVLSRTMARVSKVLDTKVTYVDRAREAKSKHIAIVNAANAEARVPLYRELIELTKPTLDEAEHMAREIPEDGGPKQAKKIKKLRARLVEIAALGRKAVYQTTRRVLEEKKVPSPQKIVSIFEGHTDIIVKDRKNVFYGHKVSFVTGKSGLLLDCVVEKGNPADVTLAPGMIDRQKAIYEKAPPQAAFDGGFASRENLDALKGKGVKDVAFSKARGLKIADMIRRGSERVFHGLRNFRAGIEAGISLLKRSFGLDRCVWHGLPSFKAYVWGSAVAMNLVTLARHLLE